MTIYLLTGPVCAGKSTVRDIMQEEMECVTYEMGDLVRPMHAEADTDLSVSEWAELQRDVQGATWLAQRTAHKIIDTEWDDNVVISGIRDPEEIKLFKDVFPHEDIEVVLVWADVFSRFQRQQDEKSLEERDDRTDDPGQFFDRDFREWQWGVDEIVYDGNFDSVIVNIGLVEHTAQQVRDIVEGKRMDIPQTIEDMQVADS